jgi:UDP-2,3-diacylglucosamine pyrophosphatase LpxH
MITCDEYDEVHVVSDLHLGGEGDFQIFDGTDELVALINDLKSRPANKKIGFIINGDFVDFLAENDAACFNPIRAESMLNRIALDPHYQPIWQALSEFCATENRRLVILIGNHDLELGLPWVQDKLFDLLSNQDPVSRSRIRFIKGKGGYLCLVNGRKILCAHGNEVDPWNVIDYKKLSDITSDIIQGRSIEAWKPNAGSRMVIEVMNEVKKHYPFIDIFKPEIEGAITALMFIDRSYLKNLPTFSDIFTRKQYDATRIATGFLQADKRTEGTELTTSIESRNAYIMDKSSIWDDVESAVDNKNKSPMDLEYAQDEGDFLGSGWASVKALFGYSKGAVLQEALEPLVKDEKFKLDYRDDTFTEMDKRVGSDIHFLITGHTHLRRAIKRDYGEGYYFNTGTWVRLFKLDEEVLKSESKMQKIYDLFTAKSMKAIDASNYLLKLRTVASILPQGNKVVGRLCNVELNAQGINYKVIKEYGV